MRRLVAWTAISVLPCALGGRVGDDVVGEVQGEGNVAGEAHGKVVGEVEAEKDEFTDEVDDVATRRKLIGQELEAIVEARRLRRRRREEAKRRRNRRQSTLSTPPPPTEEGKPEGTDAEVQEDDMPLIEWVHHCRLSHDRNEGVIKREKSVTPQDIAKAFKESGEEKKEHMFLLDMAILADMFDFRQEGDDGGKSVGDWKLKRSFDYSLDSDSSKFTADGCSQKTCAEWSQLVSLYQNSNKSCAMVFSGTDRIEDLNWPEQFEAVRGEEDFTSVKMSDEKAGEGTVLDGYKIHKGYFSRFLEFVKGKGYRNKLKQYGPIEAIKLTEEDLEMHPQMFTQKLQEQPYGEFVEFINDKCDGKTYLVGHALGGALASIAASYSTRRGDFKVAGLYTFGAPAITYTAGHSIMSHRYYESPQLGNHLGDTDKDRTKLEKAKCFPGYRVYNEDLGGFTDTGALIGASLAAHPRVSALRLQNVGRDPDRPSQTVETTIGQCESMRAWREPQPSTPKSKASKELSSMGEAYIPRLGRMTQLCRKCHKKTGTQCQRAQAQFEGEADHGTELVCKGGAVCNAIKECVCEDDTCLINGACVDGVALNDICGRMMKAQDSIEQFQED